MGRNMTDQPTPTPIRVLKISTVPDYSTVARALVAMLAVMAVITGGTAGSVAADATTDDTKPEVITDHRGAGHHARGGGSTGAVTIREQRDPRNDRPKTSDLSFLIDCDSEHCTAPH